MRRPRESSGDDAGSRSSDVARSRGARGSGGAGRARLRRRPGASPTRSARGAPVRGPLNSAAQGGPARRVRGRSRAPCDAMGDESHRLRSDELRCQVRASVSSKRRVCDVGPPIPNGQLDERDRVWCDGISARKHPRWRSPCSEAAKQRSSEAAKQRSSEAAVVFGCKARDPRSGTGGSDLTTAEAAR